MAITVSKSILLIGNWHWDIYEEALSRGFQFHGWEVIPFKMDGYLPRSWWADYLIRACFAPVLSKLNASLLGIFEAIRPEAVFLNRSDLVLPATLKRMKEIKSDAVLLLYHNDNPFVTLGNRVKMRHYLASIHETHVTLVYRRSNIEDAQRYGAKRVELFPPYYLSFRHRPLSPKDGCDVIFIGHYESDGRAECLDYLFQNGISIRVYGTFWEKVRKKYKWLADMDIQPALGEEYSSLISSAKIALAFLSGKHRDVYTRRCFEIPACGTLMMAPRTRELEHLFTDGEESVYYDSREDLLQKIHYYLDHKEERSRIAQAGRNRCLKDGHDEIGRVGRLIEIIDDIKKEFIAGKS